MKNRKTKVKFFIKFWFDFYSFRDDIINYYGLNALKRLQQQNRERDINAWVNDITSGAITKLVEQGEISSDKAILLLNAIFFEVRLVRLFLAGPFMWANIGYLKEL